MRNNTSKPVFICHSSQDKDFVRSLASDLNKHSVDVWFDEWEINVGDSITQKVSAGIHESSWLAIVLTKNAISSSWVQKELGSGLTRELHEKRVFVLPLLKEDCDIPMLLSDKKYADFRTSYSSGLRELLSVVIPSKAIKQESIKKDYMVSYYLPFVQGCLSGQVICTKYKRP